MRKICFALIFASACGAPKATPVRVVIPEPPKDETDFLLDPTIASVTTAHVPDHLVLDGDLSEWGSMLPPEKPAAKTDPANKAPKEPHKGPAQPDPNPSNAPSRVAVAIAGDGAKIAADLSELAAECVWVGIGAEPSELPPVGRYTQVEGSVNEPVMGVQIPECTPAPGDEAFDPDKDPHCQEARREREEAEEAHARRFRRLYRIDREGVRVAKEDGSLAVVTGAKVAWKPRAKGAIAEASIPAAALPRMSEAPLVHIKLVARAAKKQALPELTPDEWVALELPLPAAFEPLSELRAHAFKISKWMSYAPADPLRVEAMRYPSFEDRRAFITTDEPLYVKLVTLNYAEVGYLAIAPRIEQGESDRVMLAIIKKNQETRAVALSATPSALIERDGGLHVLCFEQHTSVYFVIGSDTPQGASFNNATLATWSAVILDEYGMYKEYSYDASSLAWDSVDPFHDKDSFGMRGYIATWATPYGDGGKVEEYRWVWTPKTQTYELKRTSLKPPRKAAKSTK